MLWTHRSCSLGRRLSGLLVLCGTARNSALASISVHSEPRSQPNVREDGVFRSFLDVCGLPYSKEHVRALQVPYGHVPFCFFFYVCGRPLVSLNWYSPPAAALLEPVRMHTRFSTSHCHFLNSKSQFFYLINIQFLSKGDIGIVMGQFFIVKDIQVPVLGTKNMHICL